VGEKVKVYFCRLQNGVSDSADSPPWKAKAEYIAQVGGSIIAETEEEVDAGLLDAEGRYDPAVGDKFDDEIPYQKVAVKPPSNPG
jgi:hypothetical protein